MKTNKRVASVALLLGLFGSALVGGASAANAGTGYTCANGATNVVNCNDTILGIPVTLAINGDRSLTTGEISVLENNLNGTSLVANLLENATVNTYSNFSPTINITGNDITTCISGVCS